ncbi:MAG: lactate racemase domain-containing protein [Planctomycetota bacterium]|jgi:nickel-dependent lactate racemase
MLRIPYGTDHVALRIPDARRRIVEPPGTQDAEPPLDAFRRSLDHPMRSETLAELAAGRAVTYLLDDATRAEPHREHVRAVLERLTGAARVRGILAVGSHERFSEGNRGILAAFSETAAELGVPHQVSVHDCRDPSLHDRLGETARGTPIEINRHVLGADLLVISSDVKNHYFAGYSNPLKAILPGTASFAAVERNHSFALRPEATFGRHPWHPDPARRANPVAEDMLEAVRKVTAGRPVFVLASLSNPAGVLWAGAGQMEAVTREAIARVDELTSVHVTPARRLIVSPGGHPQDETLYNAQRGLELSRSGVLEGGEVLFVARCARGIAPTAQARANFYDLLCAPLDEVMAGLESRYVLYAHKAYKFAHFIRSVGRLRVLTELPAEQVSAAHMEKVRDAQEVVDGWLEESDEPILVTTRANKVALYA